MSSVLIIGAGRSATSLINYMLSKAADHNWTFTVADADPEAAKRKVNGHPNGHAVWLDANKPNDRKDLIGRHKLVISMLPPGLHYQVALDCILLRKHLITASYLSKEMHDLGEQARENGLVFMGELGLDPGIDHMSAMQKIDEIRAKGGKLTAFYSHTGGLVAPESDTNPWHYKFTWNPRNVVLAGQGTAQYLYQNKLKYIIYQRLFKEARSLDIPDIGQFEMYANRDSLRYREVYGLQNIPTILRGTIRHKGFCSAWNALIAIGLTDTNLPISGSEDISYNELMDAYCSPNTPGNTVKERIANLIGTTPNSEIIEKLEWLGLFSRRKIGIPNATPALILENLLLSKWELQPNDRDMVIMHHEFEYTLDNKKHHLSSTLTMKGNDAKDTAMARLVGLPMGIFARQLLLGNITTVGVNLPVMPDVYNPVLAELKTFGVTFTEHEY